MFPLRIKSLIKILRPVQAVVLLCAIFTVVSCAFADLRPIGMSTVPEGPWALLPGAESPVMLRFDTDMEKPTVEKAMQIYSSGGVSGGEMRWEGRTLLFIPSVPWNAGVRYALRLSGTVSACDGRELQLSTDIPFYAVSRVLLPYIRSFSPPDGASTGIFGSGAISAAAAPAEETPVILELNFSLPMDSGSVENALTLDIPGQKIFNWLDDCTTVRMRTDKALNPWVLYKWTLTEKALSRDGAPLAKEVSGRFVTDLDREFIKVVRVLPLLPPEPLQPSPGSPGTALWGGWFPLAPGMEQGPWSGHGIGVEFSKPPDSESLRRAFSFVPSLPGRVEILSPVSAVFIPTKDPEPETIYSLRISGALMDTEGLRMGEDYLTSFKTDIPYLRVLSFSSGGGTSSGSTSIGGTWEAPEPGALFPVPVNAGGIIQFVIHFSLPFDSADPALREKCVFGISLRPFFPGTLPPVSLRAAQWLSSDMLLMQWEGPEGGSPGEPHYYKLLIPGGAGSAHNGSGSYLKEDFVLYLEAVDE